MQYAIARMSFGDYKNAKSYFDTAFSLADNIVGYDAYQIINHYGRLLLESCVANQSSMSPVESFLEANKIVRDEIKERYTAHYPYKVAAQYLTLIESKHTDFDASELKQFDESCK